MAARATGDLSAETRWPRPRLIRPAGNRVVAIGDSITFNNAGGWFKQLCQRTNQRAMYSGHYATQGYRGAAIRDEHLASVLALTGNQKPHACVIAAFTNDVGNGTSWVFQDSKDVLAEMIRQLEDARICPVLTKVPPHTAAQTTTAARQAGQRWNAYISYLSALTGYPLVDAHDAAASGSGDYASGASGDGTHPNGAGFALISAANAAAFAALFPQGGAYVAHDSGDPTNLTPGQQFLNTPTGGVAGSWSNFGGSGNTYSLITNDSSIIGNWQTLTRPLAGSGNAYVQCSNITTGFAVGDRMAFACLFQASNFQAQADAQNATITVAFRKSDDTTISELRPLYSSLSDFTTTATAYDEGVVPALCTKLTINLQVSGTPVTSDGATLQVAQPTLVNLTALGLD